MQQKEKQFVSAFREPRLPAFDNNEMSTGIGKFHILDTWTERNKKVQEDMSKEEKEELKNRVSKKKNDIKRQLYVQYGMNVGRSIMMAQDNQEVRSEVMQRMHYARRMRDEIPTFKKR